jgi:hypothetical protein
MNKLINNSYIISSILTIVTFVGGVLLFTYGFGEAWVTAQSPNANMIFKLIWLPFFILTLISYIFAVILAVRKNNMFLVFVYGFPLVLIAGYFLFRH